MSKLRLAVALMALLLGNSHAVLAQEAAGRILWVFGQVARIGADGAAKPLAKGDAVFEGDLIRSASDSYAQIVMSDEALIALRPQTSMQLKVYDYSGREDGTERALVELIKGGLRSVTGQIGRHYKENYQMKSGANLVGIRGTDHEFFANDEGAYDRVTVGGTYLQSPDGKVELSPGQVGFASLTIGSSPLRLESTPEFMHLAALSKTNTGPQFRSNTPGDERRLQKGALSATVNLTNAAARPVLPAQAVGENSPQQGWGRGGRCGGPCADPLNNGKGFGKGGKKGI